MKHVKATNDFAFADIASTSENFVLVIARVNDDQKIEVVEIQRRKPPFAHGPARILTDFCYELRKRGIKEVGAHRDTSTYARSEFTRNGIAYLRFDRDRPDILMHFFALQDAGDVILPSDPELSAQIKAARLMRGGPDDLVSAVAGAVVRARSGMIGARMLTKASSPKAEAPHAA